MRKFMLCFLFFTPLLCDAQSWLWGKQGTGGAHSIEGMATAIDKEDNVLLTGWFNDSVTFESYKLGTMGNDVFVVKYDSSGNLLWAKQPIVTNFAYGEGIATDASNNIYVGGCFDYTLTFGINVLNSTFTIAPFLAKYSPTGNAIWAKQGNVTGNSSCTSVATDIENNIYITGGFLDSLTLGFYKNVTLAAGGDAFIAKYDSSGNVIWVKHPYASHLSQTLGEAITTDIFGNIYLTGYFRDSLIFGSFKLISNIPASNSFLAKYDSSGKVLWAKQAVIPSSSSPAKGLAVTTDVSGNVYQTGYYTDTISFDTHKLIASKVNQNCVFLTKYDSAGNVIWVQSATPLDNDNMAGYSLATDNAKHVYLSCGTATMFPSLSNYSLAFGSDTFNLNNASDPAIVVKFDSNGNVICGSIVGSGGDDNNGISVDPSGKYVYLGGDKESTVIFGSDTLEGFGFAEYPFVARWKGDCDKIETTIKEITTSQELISLYPNPCSAILNINFSSQLNIQNPTFKIDIIDITGRVLSTYHLPLIAYDFPIDVSLLSPGMYFIRINSGSGAEVKKFIKD